MKNLRIFPDTCANTTCLLSSSTRNIAFLSASTTVPSTVIPSSFDATHASRSLQSNKPRQSSVSQEAQRRAPAYRGIPCITQIKSQSDAGRRLWLVSGCQLPVAGYQINPSLDTRYWTPDTGHRYKRNINIVRPRRTALNAENGGVFAAENRGEHV